MKKAIIITGASGDIGRSLTQSFKLSGWFVIGLDIKNIINKDKEINSCDKFYNFDLSFCMSKPEIFNDLVRKIKFEINNNSCYLYGIINNAAIQIVKPFEVISNEEWTKLFSINFFAPVALSKAFLNDLRRNNGSILNIGSIHRELSKPYFSAYATSKSALSGLTKSLSIELGDKIRVNAIEPAAIETSMLKDGFKHHPNKLKELADLHPTKKIGQPEDISNAALFLMDSKQKFINGAILKISGGIHCRLHDKL